MPLSFTVPGDPVPCGRPRFYNGRAIPDPKSKEYQVKVAAIASQAAHEAVRAGTWVEPSVDDDAGYTVSLLIARRARRGDIDNLVKSVLDGLTKSESVWPDDVRVVGLGARVIEADEPGVLVTVTRVPGRWVAKKKRKAA